MDEVLHTTDGLYSQVAELIQGARKQVATQVNSALLATYWNVGRLIVEDEQKSAHRAEYGKQVLQTLSKRLTKEFGKGFSVSNLQYMKRFYVVYQKQQTVSVKLSWSHYCELLSISDDDKRSFYEHLSAYPRTSPLWKATWSVCLFVALRTFCWSWDADLCLSAPSKG